MKNEESEHKSLDDNPLSFVDPRTVLQVISLTQDTNRNLNNVILHTDKLIKRQNILIAISSAAFALVVGLFVFVYMHLKTQELMNRQMNLIYWQMKDAEISKQVLLDEFKEIRDLIKENTKE